jgi:hypothetical protein
MEGGGVNWKQRFGKAMAVLTVSLNLFITQNAICEEGKPNPLANWYTRFTFEGRGSPGPHGVDPYIWVYTRQFAERFGMPKEWIDEGLIGAEAAAWAQIPVEGMTCGWGGKKDACTHLPEPRLYLFFDSRKQSLPWRKNGRISSSPRGGALTYLVPQSCDEINRPRSNSRVGTALAVPYPPGCPGRYRAEEPFVNTDTGEDAFWYAKGISYGGQGDVMGVKEYDRENQYPFLAWIMFNFLPPMHMGSRPEPVRLTLEIRDAPLGKTEKLLHEVILPKRFIQDVKAAENARRAADREFYKNALDMK